MSKLLLSIMLAFCLVIGMWVLPEAGDYPNLLLLTNPPISLPLQEKIISCQETNASLSKSLRDFLNTLQMEEVNKNYLSETSRY